MLVSLSEAVRTLLSGNVLSWAKFGNYEAGSVEVASPGARRLLHYLLSCDRTKVADAREDLFVELIAAWQNTSFDPATAVKPTNAVTHSGTWRLNRLEAAGFGGLNLVDGPNFDLALNAAHFQHRSYKRQPCLTQTAIWLNRQARRKYGRGSVSRHFGQYCRTGSSRP